jgi:hypothetical protein
MSIKTPAVKIAKKPYSPHLGRCGFCDAKVFAPLGDNDPPHWKGVGSLVIFDHFGCNSNDIDWKYLIGQMPNGRAALLQIACGTPVVESMFLIKKITACSW